jgi:hypothetical protein
LKVNKEVQYKYITRSQYDDVFFHNDLSGSGAGIAQEALQ